MEKKLESILDKIAAEGSLDEQAVADAKARQEVLAKPTGALGTLEDITIQLAGISV